MRPWGVTQLRRLRASPNAWGVTAIVAAVLVGNALYLLGVFDPNPIIQFSGLATHLRPGVLPGVNVIDPNAGFTSQALGHRAVLDWFGGHVPWWNPYEGLGGPLAGEMQAGAFFPPTLLLYFSTGQLYVHVVLECTAGLATYFLLLRFVRFRLVAALGGVAFALNGTFAWFEHAPVNPVAFLPLLLLGIELAIERVQLGRPRGWLTITVALALLVYAGFPEVAFIDCLLAILWLLGRLLTLERAARVPVLLRVATGVGVGLLVSAPILVSFLDYLPNADIGSHASADAYASFPRAGLPQVVFPYVYGPLFGFDASDKTGVLAQLWGGGYASALLVVLAALGVVGRTYRALRLALLAWIVLSVGKTYGVSAITHALNVIPGVKSTAFDVYAASSWELALVVLAAFGMETIILRKSGEGRRQGVVLGAAVVVLVALGFRAKPLIQSLRDVRAEHVWAGVSLGWAVASVVGIGLALLVRSTRWRIALIAGLMLVDSLGLFVVPELSAPRSATVDTAPTNYLQAHLGLDRFYSLGPILPNYGSYFGLAALTTNDTPIPKLLAHEVETKLDQNVDPVVFTGTTQVNATGPTPEQELLSNLPAYGALGVKYIVTAAPTVLPAEVRGIRLDRVFSDASVAIYQLSVVAPFYSSSDRSCAVTPIDVTKVDVSCPGRAEVVRRELFMPGWTATDNGRPVAVHQVEGVFEAIEVGAGRNTVVFTFTPPYETPAIFACALGVLAVLGSVASGVTRRRRLDAVPPPQSARASGATVGGPLPNSE